MQVEIIVLLLLALMPLHSHAEEQEPSLALLEYLGEWQDEQGHDIDPQALTLVQLDTAQERGESDDEK